MFIVYIVSYSATLHSLKKKNKTLPEVIGFKNVKILKTKNRMSTNDCLTDDSRWYDSASPVCAKLS